MTKIKNTVAYTIKRPLALTDYAIGTNSVDAGVGMAKGQSISMQLSDIREAVIAGLSPEIGGTLKITELEYTGVLTSPAAVANALDPVYIVSQYEVLVFNVNGNKYLLKLQDVTIGDGETDITDADFITIVAVKSLGDGTAVMAGYNADGEIEFRALKSTGLDISISSGNIVIESKAGTSVGDAGVEIYKGLNATTKLHEIRKAKSVGFDVTIDGDAVKFESKAGQNVGGGTNVYKELDPTTKLHKFNTLASLGSIKIIKELVDGEETGRILIDLPSLSSTPSLIVNNSAPPTYDEWVLAGGNLISNPSFDYKGIGTESQPFTDTIRYTSTTAYTLTANTAIQNALDVYVGDGSPLNPDLDGQIIKVRSNGSLYTHPGDFNYMNIYLEFEEIINCTTTGYITDMDNASFFNATTARATFVQKTRGKFIQSNGLGFRNAGNSVATSTFATGRILTIVGDGYAIYSNLNDTTKYLINADETNSLGNNNDGNLCFDIQAGLRAEFQGIYKVGGKSKIDLYDDLISGNLVGNVATNLKAFVQNGGQIRHFGNANYYFQNLNTRTDLIQFNPTSTYTTTFLANSCIFQGSAVNLFTKTTDEDVVFQVNNSLSPALAITDIFNTPITSPRWSPEFRNNNFQSGAIDVTKVDLTANNEYSSSNVIGTNILEHLVVYDSKFQANSAGRPRYSAFIKSNIVDAADLVAGVEYKVITSGSPSLGTVGSYFTALGTETGTGTASLETREILN